MVVSRAWGIQQGNGGTPIVGGHETDPRDHGRPVGLIAAGLGVPTEVFREAFTHVTPERGGGQPDPEQVRRNKDALLASLDRYGITNDQLDRVSDYYRYNERRGEVWRQRAASVSPIYTKGVVTGFKVWNGGAGYSSTPRIEVPGRTDVVASVRLSFGRDLSKNGSIAAITLVPVKR